MRSRVPFGIKNLDEMIDGGIPEGNQVIVAGGPGAGKTLLSFEYLYNNAKKGNISVLFSLEEESATIIDNAKSAFSDFKDIDELIKAGTLNIYGMESNTAYFSKDADTGSYSFTNWLSNLQTVIESKNATRVAIDSVSVLKIFIRDSFDYRNTTIQLINVLKNMKVTSLINTELETGDKNRMVFQPEFFIYDGIIAMYLMGEGNNMVQTLEVIKMRGTYHSFNTVPYEITSSGIRVLGLPQNNR